MYDNPLYDDVVKWTYVPSHKLNFLTVGPKIQKSYLGGIDRIQRQIRDRVKKAERFVLTDDYVRLAVDTSMQFAKVPTWTNLARLPYEHVWLEWDQHVKCKHAEGHAIEPFDPDLTSQRGGALFRQIDPETGLWVVQRWESQLQKNEAFMSNICWLLAPEGNAIMRFQPPAPYRPMLQVFPEIAINKHTPTVTAEEFESLSFGLYGRPELHEFVANRVVTCPDPLGMLLMQNAEDVWGAGSKTYRELRANLGKMNMWCIREDIGLMRFFVTMLAMLNEAPTVRHVAKPRGGPRYAGMNTLPYLTHSIVEVTLPKRKNAVTYLSGLFNKASAERRKNRAHWARGHWRQIEYGKGPQARACSHHPTLVEEGVGICTRCERMIRWIPSHQKGDAALGWVTHDYVIEAK